MLQDRVKERHRREVDSLESRAQKARDMIHSAKGETGRARARAKADKLDMSKVKMAERHSVESERVARMKA